MSHMRVAQGLVQLHTDCAPEGAVSLPAVMTPLLRQLGSRPPSAPGLWEVAAVVCRAGFANVQVGGWHSSWRMLYADLHRECTCLHAPPAVPAAAPP